MFIIVFSSFVSAVGMRYFILTNDFIPAGIEGISVMIGYVNGINIGYLTLIFNIPLLIAAWFFINKKYVLYTVLFIVVNSAFLLVSPYVNIEFNTEGKNILLDALFAGILLGFRTGLMLRIGGSSGGIDIIAAMLWKKFAHINFDKIMFVLNIIVLGAAFFVYGFSVYPVLLSVFYSFIHRFIVNIMLEGPKNALEFKIITDDPETLVPKIIKELKHGVTVVSVKGGYTSDDKKLLICVVNKREIARFKKIIRQHKNTFAYISNVSDIVGNFRRGRWEIPK
jgi:uncharacterized membrane-anchored protein YitT (DUF2179 family)